MGTNTTTTKDEQIQSLAKFSFICIQEKKRRQLCTGNIKRKKNIYFFRSSFEIGKFLCV
jgi:hypothetical protein